MRSAATAFITSTTRVGMDVASLPTAYILGRFNPTQAMPATAVNPTIQKQALLLAEEARRADPNIIKFYWFSAEDEVRLVEVATDMQPSLDDSVQPFYFPPSPQHNMPALSAVAIIRDGEDGRLKLPKGWGTWAEAELLNLEAAK